MSRNERGGRPLPGSRSAPTIEARRDRVRRSVGRATCLLPCLAALVQAQVCLPEFEEQPDFDVGRNAGHNLLVDLNEDGHLDLLVGLSFFLGDGAGRFETHFRLPSTPEVPEGFDVKAVDFDQDGHRDLAVVMIGGPHLNFYFGRGYSEQASELFDGPHTVETGRVVEGVWHLDTADFNGDGLTDLVGISIIRPDLMIVLNRGSRRFAATRYSSDPALDRRGNHMLATGDFDGDGRADVATGFGDRIRVLFGDGAGGFSAEVERGMARAAGPVASGHRFRARDVDGDGRAEIFATGDQWVLVYLGRDITPSGLPPAAAQALHVHPQAGVRFLEIEDVNSDGALDVTAVAEVGSQSVYRTFLGRETDGDPEFVPGAAHMTRLSGHGSVLAVGDVDGDHIRDLVLTTEDTGRGQVFLNTAGCAREIERGDANADGSFNIGDAIAVIGFLFGGGDLACANAAEVNGDGSLNISDAIGMLNYLFLAGAPPVEPRRVRC